MMYNLPPRCFFASSAYHFTSPSDTNTPPPLSRLWLCIHCDLDLGDITLCQCRETQIRHGQCTIVWNFIHDHHNMAVRSHGLDTILDYVCIVILTLKIWPWVKVITHPKMFMHNKCVKYNQDPIWQLGVIWNAVLTYIQLFEDIFNFIWRYL